MKEQFIHINVNGIKHYYSDREMKIHHREDGPAVAAEDGYKAWYINDKRHNEAGPAIVWPSGYKEWYLNGIHLTEEEFNTRMNPVTELTLQEYLECREVWGER